MKIKDVKRMKQPWDRFVYWIEERESIRRKREKGLPAPWTDDEILQRYRFCNVRRMDDKVSQWLLKNWYEPFFDHPNMLAAVALARLFNKPESLGLITDHVFPPSGGRPPFWESIKTTLRKIKDAGGTVFNGAYIVSGTSKNNVGMIEAVVDERSRPLYESSKSWKVIHVHSMERTHETISGFYGFGSFAAGQVVADLRWAMSGTWEDSKLWGPIGPGSIRGLNRLQDIPATTTHPSKKLEKMLKSTIKDCYERVPSVISDSCEGIDFENCLCEFDKYERALHGEGAPKQLYRINT